MFTCCRDVFSCFKKAEPHDSIIALGVNLNRAGSSASLICLEMDGAALPSTEATLRL